MKKQTKEELIAYRIKRAKGSIQSVKLLIDKDIDGNLSANRLYYAAFYSVIALLAQKGIEYKSHKGVKTALSNFYIKTGLINGLFGRMFTELFEMRQEGDYEDLSDVPIEVIRPYIEQVEQFIEVVERILTENTEGI